MANPRPKRDSQEIIEGRRAIAKYCGRSPRTIWDWYTYHGFPMGPLPNGHYATTPELVSRWIQVRGQLHLKNMRENHDRQHEVPDKKKRTFKVRWKNKGSRSRND